MASQARRQAFLFILKVSIFRSPSLSCVRICLKILPRLLPPLPMSTSCENVSRTSGRRQTEGEKPEPLSLFLFAAGSSMVDADVPRWDGLPCDTCAHPAIPGLPLLSYFKPSVLRFLSCQRKGDSSSLPGGVAML